MGNSNFNLFKDQDKSINKLKRTNLNQYEILSTIGKGNLSRLRLVKEKNNLDENSKLKVWKIFCKDEVIKSNQILNLKNELYINSLLNHPYLNRLYSFNQTAGHVYFELELCERGSLFSLIRRKEKISEDIARIIIYKVLIGVKYLHSLGIVWRDVKPENILISYDGIIKLCDFGISKRIFKNWTYTVCGTTRYLAPEIIYEWMINEEYDIDNNLKFIKTNQKIKRYNKGYSYTVDYWSIGILLYEIIVGIDPFFGMNDVNTKVKIMTKKVIVPKECSIQVADLINKLLVKDPKMRLGSKFGVDEILNHEFFNVINKSKESKCNVRDEYDDVLNEFFIKEGCSVIDESYNGGFDEKERVPNIINFEEDPFVGW